MLGSCPKQTQKTPKASFCVSVHGPKGAVQGARCLLHAATQEPRLLAPYPGPCTLVTVFMVGTRSPGVPAREQGTVHGEDPDLKARYRPGHSHVHSRFITKNSATGLNPAQRGLQNIASSCAQKKKCIDFGEQPSALQTGMNSQAAKRPF